MKIATEIMGCLAAEDETAASLAATLGQPVSVIDEMLAHMQAVGLVEPVEADGRRYWRAAS